MCGRGSFLLGSASYHPHIHIRYKALIETSTAVGAVRVQLHSPFLMSSRQLQFGIKCAVIVLPLRAECKSPSLFKGDEQTSTRAQPKRISVTRCDSNKCSLECICSILNLKVRLKVTLRG